jgi:hypothetical protein
VLARCRTGLVPFLTNVVPSSICAGGTPRARRAPRSHCDLSFPLCEATTPRRRRQRAAHDFDFMLQLNFCRRPPKKLCPKRPSYSLGALIPENCNSGDQHRAARPPARRRRVEVDRGS